MTRYAEVDLNVATDDSGKALAREVMQHFLVPLNQPAFFHDLDSVLAKLPAPFVSCGGAFRHNLDSVISTVSVPAQMAIASAQESRFQQLHIAERIRARSDLGPDGQPTLTALGAARERATMRMQEEIASKEGTNHIADAACAFLLRILPDPSTSAAARELLRQGAVLIWSAFEVLVRDTFVTYINSRPMLVRALVNDGNTRKLFPLRELSLDTLEKHGFDLSGNMGNILAAMNDLNHLAAIKDVLNVLFPDASGLRTVLGAKRLWLLFQRRNLIVHTRGVVDGKYLEKTGENLAIGEMLVVTPDEIAQDLTLVRDVGKELLGSVVDSFAAEDKSE